MTMFTVTSNPFAEMTQGLSGQQYTEQERPFVHEPVFSKSDDYNNDYYYKPKKSSSSNGWKVVLVVIVIFSGIGLFLWLYSNYQNKKEEERKKLEEEKKKLLEQEEKNTPV
jgi:nitric oxide reductase large subunit